MKKAKVFFSVHLLSRDGSGWNGSNLFLLRTGAKAPVRGGLMRLSDRTRQQGDSCRNFLSRVQPRSHYWSSTENNNNNAWYETLSSGSQSNNNKNNGNYVRCVRS